MKITRRTDYAVHLIADLAEQPNTALGLRSLAEKHNVTYAYARTVAQGLQQAGIILSTRGINGGIKLAKPLKDITLLEVFEAAQGSLEAALDNSDASWCSCENGCISEHSWTTTKTVLGNHLTSITLHQIVKGKK